jgi:hypothetical protein
MMPDRTLVLDHPAQLGGRFAEADRHIAHQREIV